MKADLTKVGFSGTLRVVSGPERVEEKGDISMVVRFPAALVAAMFLFIFFVFSPSVASAETLNLTTLPAQTYAGYYVGPAFGLLDGAPVAVVCNDFSHTTYIPSTFDVNVSTIPSLTGARFQSGAPENYEMASILLYEMGLPSNSSDIGGIQFAIWNIFESTAPDPGTSNTWLAWAQSQNLNNWDYSMVRVLTPTVQYATNQGFMNGSATPTPEPATEWLFLCGGGLLAIGKFHWRRRQRQRDSNS